jgi:hypothetical protein
MAVAEKVGFAIGHAIMRTISVLCVVAVLGGIGWAIYVGFVKPHTNPNPTSTTNQQAEKIVNQHLTIDQESCWINFLGIKTLCFKDKTTHKIIQKEGELKLEKKRTWGD